jgi:hypothetical protein
MMAMAQSEPTPTWRNFAVWGAAGAIFYVVAVSGASLLVHEDGIGAMLRSILESKAAVAVLGLGLIFATAVAGFTSRKRPISLRALRNFVIRDAVAVIAFLLVLWGFSALAGAGALGAMGASEWAAAVTGSVLIIVASLGVLAVASAHTGADLIDDETAAEEMRERGRLILYSLAWMAACGLLLIVLGLSGPGGVLSQAAALAGALLLIAVLAGLGIAAWRLSDELGRTLSHETGNMAFYLILVLGGGWAMLAHLGFVAGPAPLDWLTLFTVLLFAASFIVLGRRKLLTH